MRPRMERFKQFPHWVVIVEFLADRINGHVFTTKAQFPSNINMLCQEIDGADQVEEEFLEGLLSLGRLHTGEISSF